MNSDIAREVAATLASTEPTIKIGWKWSKGVVLFPESRCPYCHSVIKSKAIWLVRGNYLIGQGVPRAGQVLKLDPPFHPHAIPSAICMGDASEPLQALFNGLNPDSAYIPVDTWLKGRYWEHSCPEMEEAKSDDEYEYNCVSCGTGLNDEDTYRFGNCLYCDYCFYRRAFYCGCCDDTCDIDEKRETPNGELWCPSCFSERYFTCTDCDETLPLDENYHDGVCEDCYEWPNGCAKCGTGFDKEDTGTDCDDCDQEFCSAYCKIDTECSAPRCDICSDHYKEDDGEYCIICIRHYCPDCTGEHEEHPE